jgi:MFS family permease
VVLVAVGLFAGASILTALSANMPMLIAGRALQGAASGGLMQLATIIISDLFSVRERALNLAYDGFVWALAGSAGPLTEGAFTQFKSWRGASGLTSLYLGQLSSSYFFSWIYTTRVRS